MINFKKLLAQTASEASKLPSFPQKGKTYNINAKTPDMSAHEEWTEQENNFGKMVRRKQTVYHVNTKEGLIRISPNQIQQLSDILQNAKVNEETEFITVRTADSDHGLIFTLQ